MCPLIEEASAGDKMASYMSLIATLFLRYVSPSKFIVSTYAIPFVFELLRSIRSAGNL
jgi:hypothetical protein